jgi:hypothetical protein
MAATNKILGQVMPTLETNTTLYSVPLLTQANVNIWVCNQAAVADVIRVGVTVAGNSFPADNAYIAYDVEVDANSTINFTGLCLGPADFISVYSTNGTCSFVAMGLEVT